MYFCRRRAARPAQGPQYPARLQGVRKQRLPAAPRHRAGIVQPGARLGTSIRQVLVRYILNTLRAETCGFIVFCCQHMLSAGSFDSCSFGLFSFSILFFTFVSSLIIVLFTVFANFSHAAGRVEPEVRHFRHEGARAVCRAPAAAVLGHAVSHWHALRRQPK